jgi:hypothetical protein
MQAPRALPRTQIFAAGSGGDKFKCRYEVHAATEIMSTEETTGWRQYQFHHRKDQFAETTTCFWQLEMAACFEAPVRRARSRQQREYKLTAAVPELSAFLHREYRLAPGA